MATSSAERNRANAAQIWMLQAENIFPPRHVHIRLRGREAERVVMAWTLDVVNCTLSAKWIPAIFQYPFNLFAADFIPF
jgi:hypothetical protein